MAANTFALVHGAWMGKFCWAEVAAKLEAMGHAVLTLDLPAHGPD
jgi:alpha-beta hydrolase superfamily lysophospholipase